VDEGTQRGNMGIALQRMYPKARVRYFSATGATEARHMAPYERLGLWGEGAPFADFSAFLVAMERGGVAAMEMLCRDLKAVGTYLSRTISYGPTRRADGSIVPESAVEYEPLLHRLTDAEKGQYDEIADLWAELLIAFEAGEQNACQKRNGSRYAQFYSAQQRFFLQLMMAYTLPDVIPEIEKDLAAGRSVVVSLFNTGEAQADRKVRDARAQGLELNELDATPREMIVQLIEKQFPIYQYREETDPVTGNVICVRVTDAAGNPEINRENLRRQKELLNKVADLDFPHNPMDALIAHFGVENVSEISGRTHRWEHGRYVRRKLHGVHRRQPTLRHVVREDLHDPKRLHELHRQAIAAALISQSECDRLRFFAAAEHAKAIGSRNPCGLFAAVVRRGLWRYITQDDEDVAVNVLKRTVPCFETSSDEPVKLKSEQVWGGPGMDPNEIRALVQASLAEADV
jgi:hypothetical protein